MTIAGGIGQPLSLLLKLNKKVSNLALYDIRGTPGVAADISHIDTRSTVHPSPLNPNLGVRIRSRNRGRWFRKGFRGR